MASSFPGFMVFGAMSIMLLLGVLLRAKIRFLQTTMVPASLIGGVLGFILISLGWLRYEGPDGSWLVMNPQDFLPFTFHAFNISFISLCLTRSENTGPRSSVLKGGLWLSMMWSASLTVQALVGAGTVVVYNLVTGGDVNTFLGYLVTHGFTQGPGQGFALGKAWAQGFNIPDAPTMGLIWATAGFFFAYVVGVPMARNFVKKGQNANQRSSVNEEFLTGILNKDTHIEAGRETTHSSTVETLAFHLAIIGLIYVISYAEITIMRKFVKHLFFSYPLFFFHGLVWALVIRKIMDKLGIGYLTDPGIQKRITGLSVDYLLVASIMGISFIVLTKYIGVILTVCVTVTLVTYLMIRFFRTRLSELGPERAVAAFGCCLGSTASGLLLLRILDADYSTGVGLELAFFNAAILFTTFPILIIMVPQLPSYSPVTIVAAYAVYTLVCFVALWFLGPWKKRQPEAA